MQKKRKAPEAPSPQKPQLVDTRFKQGGSHKGRQQQQGGKKRMRTVLRQQKRQAKKGGKGEEAKGKPKTAAGDASSRPGSAQKPQQPKRPAPSASAKPAGAVGAATAASKLKSALKNVCCWCPPSRALT
jgi:hypothetical protein